MEITLIGNAPSSGSTLLADLLDSTSYSICGEEFDLFANRHLYNFKEFKKSPFHNSGTTAFYLNRTFFSKDFFEQYGLSEIDFFSILEDSKKPEELAYRIGEKAFNFRNKKDEKYKIWFEKTPLNINTIEEFLIEFPDSYFIFMVRNPLYVYSSLIRRNIPKNIALLTWFISTAKYLNFKNHPRVKLLKYEDLVYDPFNYISSLFQSLYKININPEDIKKGYENNKFREVNTAKDKSWGINEYGKIGNANNKKIDPILLKDFLAVTNYSFSKGFSKKFKLSEKYSFENMIEAMGYTDDLKKIISFENRSKIKFTKREYYTLYRKWKRDYKNNEASLKDLICYINPIQKVK